MKTMQLFELWECGACLCAIFSSEVHVDAIMPIFGAPCHSDQEKKSASYVWCNFFFI